MDLVKIPWGKCLRLPCEDAAPPFKGEKWSRVWNMVHLMREQAGIGLAGPQVAWQRRLFVVDIEAVGASTYENGTGIDDLPDELGGDWVCCCNAVFTPAEDAEPVAMWEGCLSVPRAQRLVRRPEAGTVEYTDMDGKRHKHPVSGLLARVFQHEIDHTRGVLITSPERHK